MRFFSTLLLAAFWSLFTTASPAGAAVISSNTIISKANSFPGEAVSVIDGDRPPTVVQMVEGGEAARLSLFGRSQLNFMGGTVSQLIDARDQSVLKMFGGTVPTIDVSFGASASIAGGTVTGDLVLKASQGSPSVDVFGGQLRDVLSGGSNPFSLNVHGGSFERIRLEGARGLLNISGGSIDRFTLRGSVVAHLSGGDVRANFSTLRDDSDLHVYGHKLTYGQDVAGIWRLNGTLLDGTELTNFHVDQLDSSSVILHNVPEPATIAILAFGLPFILARGRKRCV